MAKDITGFNRGQELDVRQIAQEEVDKRFEEWRQSHLKTTPDVDMGDEIMDALGTMTGAMIAKFPLSLLWILGSILVGIGTGEFFQSLGWGLISLAIGWIVLRIARHVD